MNYLKNEPVFNLPIFQIAFSDWINSNLATDKDVQHLIPLSADGKDLYPKITDGILLM